jgi:hypothetical protein
MDLLCFEACTLRSKVADFMVGYLSENKSGSAVAMEISLHTVLIESNSFTGDLRGISWVKEGNLPLSMT